MLRLLFACFIAGTSISVADDATNNWPRFRGPAGDGHSTEKSLPTKWDDSSLAWKLPLPVDGQSSPIIWGNRVFLTGTKGSGERVERHVLCIDRQTQEILWDKAVAEGAGETLHKMNTWATPSCATDGEVVVAFFGPGGLHCFDFDGDLKWSRKLGDFPGMWGVGASPIIVGDLVIQNCDAQGDSYLAAFNRETGKDVWKTDRRAKPRGGWSTPILIETKKRQELVLNGEFGVTSYDPKSGKELWFCESFNGRGSPAPVFGNGMLYVVSGKIGDTYAVKPGGSGDVSSTRQRVWRAPRNGRRDLASPILSNDCVVVIGMQAVATGYDAQTGEELWKSRLNGNFSASPIAADGLVFANDEAGTVHVLKVGKTCETIAKNRLDTPVGETFRSSMAVSDGQLFLRSNKHLYCIGNRNKKVAGR